MKQTFRPLQQIAVTLCLFIGFGSQALAHDDASAAPTTGAYVGMAVMVVFLAPALVILAAMLIGFFKMAAALWWEIMRDAWELLR